MDKQNVYGILLGHVIAITRNKVLTHAVTRMKSENRLHEDSHKRTNIS